jgi:hypothetical protein
MRERKGAIKQQQLRRSQSPATSDGDVSSSPSVGSDDDENAALPKATLSVWIAEGAYNIYIFLFNKKCEVILTSAKQKTQLELPQMQP